MLWRLAKHFENKTIKQSDFQALLVLELADGKSRSKRCMLRIAFMWARCGAPSVKTRDHGVQMRPELIRRKCLQRPPDVLDHPPSVRRESIEWIWVGWERWSEFSGYLGLAPGWTLLSMWHVHERWKGGANIITSTASLIEALAKIICEMDVDSTDPSSEDASQLWLTAEQARYLGQPVISITYLRWKRSPQS